MYLFRKLSVTALCFAIPIGFAAAPVHAQIVQNGSFEQGNATGDPSLAVGSTAIPGWTVTNAEIAFGTNGVYGLATPYGSQFVDLTGYHDSVPYGGITQNIATITGTSYHLSFALGADQSSSIYSGPVSAAASAGGASQAFTFTPALGSTGNQWGTFGLDFIAAGTSTPITFIGTLSTGGQFIGLDNVAVTQNSPVPEASTTISFGLLLMLGLGGLAVAKKRKQSAASA